jgi:hypothetical protein
MAITVTCPKCHSRFNVSEKYAGKKGPCPKCKQVLTIPTADQQIKIHEREHEGARGASGQLLLKPTEREKFKARPLLIVGIIVPVLLVLGGAFFLGSSARSEAAKLAPQEPPVIGPGETLPEEPAVNPAVAALFEHSPILIGIGALVLAAPMVVAGYGMLRNDELEPYKGSEFLVRTAICSVAYALLWGVYWFVPIEYRDVSTDMMMTSVVVIPFLLVGAGTAFASLDLDFGNGFFHYVLYFSVCIVCRLLLGWPVL